MDDLEFRIIEDNVYVYRHLTGNFYETHLVMDKETFIKCYKKWILEEGEE